jgi:Asp-tRNA(Asn)/Glu-tRNA(Gln) amidotransferase A subunit family amidase
LACTAFSLVFAIVTATVGAAQNAPDAFHLEEAMIDDIQQAIQTGQITTVELVEAYLKRIRAYNGVCVEQPQGILLPITPIPNAGQINALSTLNLRPATREIWGFDARKARSMSDPVDNDPVMPDALETAAALDLHFRQTGRLIGPLHGVVVAIKDQYDTFDMRTTSGADARYANDRPPDDATIVKRLRDAGAIILAKANMGEYASNGSRSSFGGTFCNPYDTERVPGMSSAGSASAVAANLVTCAIGEETVVSIRWPSAVNSLVGLAPTQELVSRDGMIGAGLNMRTGPICRNVSDAARILDVIAGYDPKDELTVFSVGRTPAKPYASFAAAKRLDGLRIGVVREYMQKELFSKADEESIEIVERALEDLRRLGATIVDPGPQGALFQNCIARYAPQYYNAALASRYPELFPVESDGTPATDHITTLVEMSVDPALIPEDLSIRNLGGFSAEGESKYMINKYLRERGDPNIQSNADLISKATFYEDTNFPDRKQRRESDERALVMDTSTRMQHRFAMQLIVMQCMQEHNLDVLAYPTANVPPPKLNAPQEPKVNGRSPVGWSFLGSEGFPALTVPAGFTTEVWDRVHNADGEGTRLVGPISARLPVGIDFLARPFDEPLLFRVGSAYEAATHHRRPPSDFGPLREEP